MHREEQRNEVDASIPSLPIWQDFRTLSRSSITLMNTYPDITVIRMWQYKRGRERSSAVAEPVETAAWSC